MAKIFISYARADGYEHANEIANRLRILNHDIFMDIHGIAGGTEWEKQLIKSGKWADVLLLLITPASNQSKPVYHEFREAEKNGKLI
ncbi:MAG TPA: toll/interleukin-1 receptor domain-containing protein, partial [Aggregatilineales bacterium]|nr:toll/interleukin-1 receptor domain-containing protein [Aggregatilineales bacterium]